MADTTVACLGADGSWIASGASAAEGGFRVALDDGVEFPVTVVARRAGFALRDLELASQPPDPIRLELEREAIVTGRVRTPDGSPPRVPIQVLAWDSGRPRPGESEIASARSAPSAYVSAMTDATGAFELRGLTNGTRYLLFAGGQGYLPVGDGVAQDVALTAPARDVDLVVGPVYILDVEFLDEGGGPIETDPRLVAYPGTSAELPRDACSISSASPSLGIAHVELFGAERDYDATGFRSVYTSQIDADRIGPFPFRATAPGYEPATAQVWAYRYADGKCRTQEIRLHRLVRGLGSLKLETGGPGATPAGGARSPDKKARTPFALVRLHPDGWTLPGTAFLEFMYWAPVREPMVLANVPEGAYRVAFVPMLGECPAPKHVTIRGGGTGEVVFELESGALLEVLLAGHRGRAVVDIRYQTPKGTRGASFAFDGPPYRVFGCPPGRYDVEVFGDDGRASQALPVSLVAGGTTSVTVALDRERLGR